eukprot:342181-Prorocentrum_minimum.AAC.2
MARINVGEKGAGEELATPPTHHRNIRPGSPPFNSRWFRGGKKYAFKQNATHVTWEPKHPQQVRNDAQEGALAIKCVRLAVPLR